MSFKSKNPVFFYREFVETALTEKPRNLFQKAYGGVILGGKKFIEEVLDRLNDQDVQKKEISHRRFLGAITSDMDEIVDLLCNQLKVSREQVQSASPYKEGVRCIPCGEAHALFEPGDRQVFRRYQLLCGYQDWDKDQRQDEEKQEAERGNDRASEGSVPCQGLTPLHSTQNR